LRGGITPVTCNGLVTLLTDLSKQFDVALWAVGVIVLGSELNVGELGITLGAQEALTMESGIAESNTSLQQHLKPNEQTISLLNHPIIKITIQLLK